MVSRGISKKGFRGEQKTTGGKGSKHKVYCIFEKEGYIYFPVAAKWSPYFLKKSIEKESYLAGMPNFFGGNKEKNEGAEQALAREIREESQGRIDAEISAGALEPPFLDVSPKPGDADQNIYEFYILRSEKCSIKNFQWGEEDVFRLRSFEEGGIHAIDYPAYYEDSLLVRMDTRQFQAFIGGLRDLREVTDEEARMAEIESTLAGLGITHITSPVSIRNWFGSHTSIAFMESLSRI